MWICFDCKRENAGLRCRRYHRCVNVDFRSWSSKNWLLFVGCRVYSNAASRCYYVHPESKLEKRILMWMEAEAIEKLVTFDSCCGVKYAIIDDDLWQKILKKAEELKFQDALTNLNSRLDILYADIVQTGNIRSWHKYDVNKIKEYIAKYGFKYVEELRKKIESNEMLSEKAKMKLLEILLGDIL